MGLTSAGEIAIEVLKGGDAKAVAAIAARLSVFNGLFAGAPEFHPLIVVLKAADGDVIGGLVGETVYSWLSIQILFVPEALRGRGLGTALIQRAEQAARRRGCVGMVVNTFSFQARPFYERLGFTLFGTLEDCPPGHRCYYLRKAIRST